MYFFCFFRLNRRIIYFVEINVSTSTIHTQLDKYLLEVLTQISENGIDKTLTKENIKKIYDKYCVRMEKYDENKI